MSAIRFLTALAKSVHSKLFSDDSTLKQVQLASPPAGASCLASSEGVLARPAARTL